MKDLKIHATRRCEECNGRGYLDNGVWARFHEAVDTWQEAHPKPIGTHAAPIDAWYGALDQFEEQWWTRRSYSLRNLPPEENPCHVCNGTGTEAFNLTLEALAELLREETA